MELDLSQLPADDLDRLVDLAVGWQARWPADDPVVKAFLLDLAAGLLQTQLALETRIAGLELGQMDTVTGRMRLGMVSPDEPIRLGWIDEPSPDDLATGPDDGVDGR